MVYRMSDVFGDVTEDGRSAKPDEEFFAELAAEFIEDLEAIMRNHQRFSRWMREKKFKDVSTALRVPVIV